MELIWSKPAQYSLLDIAQYVEQHFDQRLARKVVSEIRKSAGILKLNPGAGRKVKGLDTNREIRCLPYKQDLLYYYVEDDRVIIMLVWDGRKNPEDLLDHLKCYCEHV